jgi:hypothetical protein
MKHRCEARAVRHSLPVRAFLFDGPLRDSPQFATRFLEARRAVPAAAVQPKRGTLLFRDQFHSAADLVGAPVAGVRGEIVGLVEYRDPSGAAIIAPLP